MLMATTAKSIAGRRIETFIASSTGGGNRSARGTEAAWNRIGEEMFFVGSALDEADRSSETTDPRPIRCPAHEKCTGRTVILGLVSRNGMERAFAAAGTSFSLQRSAKQVVSSEMMPSTPYSAKRCMSAGSLTVQTRTFFPAPFILRISSGSASVLLRNHILHRKFAPVAELRLGLTNQAKRNRRVQRAHRLQRSGHKG